MQGNLDQAKKALKQAQTLEPNSAEVRYNQAMIAVSEGSLDQAATLLQQLAASTEKKDGNYTEDEKNNRGIFLYRLARVYRDQNKTAEAIATYKQIIALGGDNAERGYQGEIDAYNDARMLPQAMAAAEEAVKTLPKSATMKLTLANQLVESGKTKQGIDLAKAQLNGSKQDRTVWLTLAQLYTRSRQWKKAGEAIDRVAKQGESKQDTALVYFLRGALAERQKRIDTSVKLFEQSLALDPDNALTLNYLGYTLANHDLKLNEALHLTEHAVRLDPMNGAYLDSLGWAHYKLGQYEQAEKTLKRAVALMPTDPTVRDHLGQVYASTGHLHEAVAQWQSSLANYARSAPADASPSDVKKVRERLDKAKQKLAHEESSEQRQGHSNSQPGADPSAPNNSASH
jgi:tetratricopeptide (TPR) repeat protein